MLYVNFYFIFYFFLYTNIKKIFGSVQYKSETNHVDDTKDLPSSEEEMDKAEMQEDSTEAVVPTQSSATLMVKTEMQEDSTEAVAPTHSSTTVEVPFDILVTFLQSNGVLPIPYNGMCTFVYKVYHLII